MLSIIRRTLNDLLFLIILLSPYRGTNYEFRQFLKLRLRLRVRFRLRLRRFATAPAGVAPAAQKTRGVRSLRILLLKKRRRRSRLLARKSKLRPAKRSEAGEAELDRRAEQITT